MILIIMNYSENLKKRLIKYSYEDIIITDHANEQAIFRSLDIEEVKKNILNPERLTVALKQKPRMLNEEKYDCYFSYSRTQCHRYILIVNKHCVVCTVIKINRRWQRIVEKNAGL